MTALTKRDYINAAVALTASADRALTQSRKERKAGNHDAADFCVSVFEDNTAAAARFFAAADCTTNFQA